MIASILILDHHTRTPGFLSTYPGKPDSTHSEMPVEPTLPPVETRGFSRKSLCFSHLKPTIFYVTIRVPFLCERIIMDDIRHAVAANVTALRKQNGLTQAELAEKLNYSDKAVSKWERGESIPDVAVLQQIADLFHVSVDYLLQADHTPKQEKALPLYKRKTVVITGLAILLVWFLATVGFVVLDSTPAKPPVTLLPFLYAVPVSMIVWLVFNTLWFNKRRNYLIISLLMWTVLLSVFLTMWVFGVFFWQTLLLGIPGQAIILTWSRLHVKKPKQAETVDQ